MHSVGKQQKSRDDDDDDYLFMHSIEKTVPPPRRPSASVPSLPPYSAPTSDSESESEAPRPAEAVNAPASWTVQESTSVHHYFIVCYRVLLDLYFW